MMQSCTSTDVICDTGCMDRYEYITIFFHIEVYSHIAGRAIDLTSLYMCIVCADRYKSTYIYLLYTTHISTILTLLSEK